MLVTESPRDAAMGSRAPRTVIYVHGIGNKAPAAVLKCQWDRALFDADLGDRSRMAYWVNRDYYPTPLDEGCADKDIVRVDDDEATTRAIIALGSGEPGDEAKAIEREIIALAGDDLGKQKTLTHIAAAMTRRSVTLPDSIETDAEVGVRVLPVPGFMRRLIAGKLTRALLRDVNDFLYSEKRRADMIKSVTDRLRAGGGPFVLVAHSQGSMIAYQALRELEAEQPGAIDVALFVTIGSPLGLQEVQDELKKWKPDRDLARPECVQRWINVADRLDPVAFDPDLRNDYAGGIENFNGFGRNPDSPRHPHSATGYLSAPITRKLVRETVGVAFGQAIAPWVIAKDLVNDVENATDDLRHPILIQLVNDNDPTAPLLDEAADMVAQQIGGLLDEQGLNRDLAEIDRLKRFVSAKLTRLEIEVLRSRNTELAIQGVWRNGTKQALIYQSSHTVQAAPANIGYGADGRQIDWAVLDTGIAAGHPHFTDRMIPEGQSGRCLVVQQFDCLSRGEPRRLLPGEPEFDHLDRHGHGTHVAGIISGQHEAIVPKLGKVRVAGMAPRCRLHGFKVLDDDGGGSDASIIKALDKIVQLNDAAGRLVIQGVNLSLGGRFDPATFNVGHTPLCQELKRLWRQGVVVVLAAGNEGYLVLRGERGWVPANMDLTIGDPANLEEAIAVGSVHKTNPVTYGISFFSSRGPTADGRPKPDVVAPGERIASARHDWNKAAADLPDIDELYVELSGTSMAAPHVSGIIASYLSLRREFIGEPDRVKATLMNNCMDLRRDQYMQGAGIPNLISMLALGHD